MLALTNRMEAKDEIRDNLFAIYEIVRYNQALFVPHEEDEEVQAFGGAPSQYEERPLKLAERGKGIINYYFGECDLDAALKPYRQAEKPAP